MTGIVLAAALAAIMSTASATLLAASTITATDLLRQTKDALTATRIATLVLGVAVVGVALVIDDVVAALTVAYDLLTGALFVPIVLGLLWSRGTSRAAVASMSVCAVDLVLVLLFTRGLYSNAPIIWGLVSSLVVFVGVSLLPERGDARGACAADHGMTLGEAVVRALAERGVELVFGIPGTHTLELHRHLAAYGIRHVTPRHEAGGAYAADGYARVTGRPGVVLVTSGPGVINTATAAATAYADSVPMLILSPSMPTSVEGRDTGFLHESKDQGAAMAGLVTSRTAHTARGRGRRDPRRLHPSAAPAPSTSSSRSTAFQRPSTNPQGGLTPLDDLTPRGSDPGGAGVRRSALVLGGGARGAGEAALAARAADRHDRQREGRGGRAAPAVAGRFDPAALRAALAGAARHGDRGGDRARGVGPVGAAAGAAQRDPGRHRPRPARQERRRRRERIDGRRARRCSRRMSRRSRGRTT